MNVHLPIYTHFKEITTLLTTHQVILVAGETGSGKSTQLPQLCYALFKDKVGLIGHTQPRRIAAKTIAARIALELNTPLGHLVGYQMRFNDALSDATRIKVMTDGILLAETAHDPLLKKYHTLIIDEAHERSLNIDFILGYFKKILYRRPDLKIIITSATLDHEKLAKHFNAPIVVVEGRTFPIEIRYQALDSPTKEIQSTLFASVSAALDRLQDEASGDTLVFLPTEREIRDLRRKLSVRFNRHEVLPLYARLPLSAQQKIFHRGSIPRIILATNVAETSLTVPNVRYVVDSGLARISRFNARFKIQRLPIEAISQANANQRAGRAGRTSPGIVIRLYAEEDFNKRPLFLEPELFRTSLSAVILTMLKLNLGNIVDFPFIDLPPHSSINEGYKELIALQAIEKYQDQYRLTEVGRHMNRFPLDPRLARMLIAGDQFQVLAEILIIISHLSIQNPREYPEDQLERAKNMHRQYEHPESEFLTILNLWHSIQAERHKLSNNQFKQYCQSHFFSYSRLCEWQDLHHELTELATPTGAKHAKPADKVHYQMLHQAILTGSLHFIGMYDEEKKCFRGAENKLFYIFPGSALVKKKFKWLMAESLMETQKVYARMIARIEPNWLEPLSRHLSRKHYSEPMYDVKMDEVMAFETVLLYGLPIISRRKVMFAHKNLVLAREIFIREGLIPTQNRAEKAILENWENKLRRLGFCFSDDEAYQFYDKTLPPDARSFKSMQGPIPQLDISERLQALQPFLAEYPDELMIQGAVYPLTYLFEPGEPADGVTMQIQIPQLLQLHPPVQHPHAEYNLKFLVVDEAGKGLAKSNSISALKQHFSEQLNILVNQANSPFDDQIYQSWSFGDLPLQINQGFTAVSPHKTLQGIQLKIHHDPLTAQAIHPKGVFLLARLDYAREIKALKQDSTILGRLSELSFIQDKTSLTTEFTDFALAFFFARAEVDLAQIYTETQFKNLRDLKAKFYPHQVYLQNWLGNLTRPLLNIRVQLKNLSAKQGLAESLKDIQNHFLALCTPHFFTTTPLKYMERYPIYFKGIELRIQRLQHNPERELKLAAELNSIWQQRPSALPITLRWLFEEYRLSLFAQELKTILPMSTQKMQNYLKS